MGKKSALSCVFSTDGGQIAAIAGFFLAFFVGGIGAIAQPVAQWGLGAPVQAGLQAEDEDDDIEEAMNSGYVSIMTIVKN